ncbi:MAG TPA: hypothetical protein VER79_06160, partial [Candidatus Limnocylindrales bacterium]|nr:hypothetical protein [Candidatus Limnocylindrales bacterium]
MEKPTGVRSRAVVALIAVAVVVITGALFVFALTVIIPALGNAFDFYPNWVGSRAVLGGELPYSRAVTERIQIGMFG